MASSNSALSSLRYPYPKDVNVSDFVHVMLSEQNYVVWREQMLRLIESQGLVGFIDVDDVHGFTIPKRQDMKNPQDWKRSDALLQRWIIRTISDDVLPHVVRLETANAMWLTLKFLYGRNMNRHEETKEEENPMAQYLPIRKAALRGDWAAAKEFITKKPGAERAFITGRNETALIIAVRSAQGNHFVEKLLEEFMSPEDVAIPDLYGRTALHYAATAGNTEAAKFLVEKNPLLPNICPTVAKYPSLAGTDIGQYPSLHYAAQNGRRKTVEYLLHVTKDNVDPKPFEGKIGIQLVQYLLHAGLYDIALLLILRYPKLAWEKGCSALENIALNGSSAFKSGAHLNRCQSLIYRFVPTELEAVYYFYGGDIENSTNSSSLSVRVKQQLYYVMWIVILILVPQVKKIREIKMQHEQALQLVKHLCNNTLKLTGSKADIMRKCLLDAANSGIPEVVEEICDSFTEYTYFINRMGRNIFHLAVLNRCESVFNLIYQFRQEVRHGILTKRDSHNKTCLDLVVDLKKEQKLNLRTSAAGAALQMQRELQWYKEVEKHTINYYKGSRDKETTTSGTIYIDTHEELVKEGEKWMKETATSCTIIAALVATVVFAAAITVPGGNDGGNGLPILFRDKAFIFFIIADAIALFSSISSVLMFLAILTSRYSVTDFLFTLPNRLIIGLLSLFVSLISMMIAFGATLYLLFGHNGTWILIPIIVFSCFPVTVFVKSQFPLLWDMMISTYGSGIFRQQSDRILM